MADKRIRRTKQASRLAILEAAERTFMREGLEAVRVQKIAAEVGVTDAAVHYHFGSRQGLLEALLRHAGRRLMKEVARASRAEGQDLDVPAVSAAFRRAYVDAGGGRLAAWLSLAGWNPQGTGLLNPLIERAHALRLAQAGLSGAAPADLEDTRHLIALLNAAHIAQAVLGEALLKAVDKDGGPESQAAFLDWTVRLVSREIFGEAFSGAA